MHGGNEDRTRRIEPPGLKKQGGLPGPRPSATRKFEDRLPGSIKEEGWLSRDVISYTTSRSQTPVEAGGSIMLPYPLAILVSAIFIRRANVPVASGRRYVQQQ